ncbi:MAG: SEC-C domain-containing protein [Elusimicrobia bacterium]|nr:SEC-C domain-containing protein [Elusimicrobiota bacterium]
MSIRSLWDKFVGKKDNGSEAKVKPSAKETALEELQKFKGDRKQLFKMLRNPQVRQQVAVLYQRMQADGVDLKNEAQVQEWANKHKDEFEKPGQAPKVEQVVYDREPLGRNDPCSCGSGKKYKKCCAAEKQ